MRPLFHLFACVWPLVQDQGGHTCAGNKTSRNARRDAAWTKSRKSKGLQLKIKARSYGPRSYDWSNMRRRSLRVQHSIQLFAAEQQHTADYDPCEQTLNTRGGITVTADGGTIGPPPDAMQALQRQNSSRGTLILNASELEALKYVHDSREQQPAEQGGIDSLDIAVDAVALEGGGGAGGGAAPPPASPPKRQHHRAMTTMATGVDAVDAAVAAVDAAAARGGAMAAADVDFASSSAAGPPSSDSSAVAQTAASSVTAGGRIRGAHGGGGGGGGGGISLKVMPFAPEQGLPRPPAYAVAVEGEGCALELELAAKGGQLLHVVPLKGGEGGSRGGEVEARAGGAKGGGDEEGQQRVMCIRRATGGAGGGYVVHAGAAVPEDSGAAAAAASSFGAGLDEVALTEAAAASAAAPHGAYVRLCVSTVQHETSFGSQWPLVRGAMFKIGSTEFVVLDTQDGGGGGAEGEGEGAQLRFRGVCGALSGKTYQIDRAGASVGRAVDNAIHAGDAQLSRRHAAIVLEAGGSGAFHLVDLGSTNGTYVKIFGPYATRPHPLRLGDQLLAANAALAVNRYDHAASCHIGPRRTMEDAHTVVQDMRVGTCDRDGRGTILQRLGLAPQSFFAVFDGHGGSEASAFLGQHMHHLLQQALAAAAPEMEAAADAGSAGECDWAAIDKIMERAVTDCFEAADARFVAESAKPQAGSTAITALLLGRRLYVSNVGDSRAVVCTGAGEALAMSEDHAPSRPDEAERIRKAGGFVIHKRVMGELAVSRAFGDVEFKTGDAVMVRRCACFVCGESAQSHPLLCIDCCSPQLQPIEDAPEGVVPGPLVIATPDVRVRQLEESDDFLLLACDGLYDVFSNENAVEFIRCVPAQRVPLKLTIGQASSQDPPSRARTCCHGPPLLICACRDELRKTDGDLQHACDAIVHEALHQRGSRDNVTVVVTRLSHAPQQ
jgi:serine/threonine protein phosphatase PrpC